MSAVVGAAVAPPGMLCTLLLSLVRCVRMCRSGRTVYHRLSDAVASGAGSRGRHVEVDAGVLVCVFVSSVAVVGVSCYPQQVGGARLGDQTRGRELMMQTRRALGVEIVDPQGYSRSVFACASSPNVCTCKRYDGVCRT